MILYYLEKKSFFRAHSGYEYQMADAGEMPLLFKTEEEAMKIVKKLRNLYKENFKYEETINNESYPCYSKDRVFACRFESYKKDYRYELRVYKIEI